MQQKIGLDAGGTLLKVAFFEKEKLHLKKYSYDELDSLIQWLGIIGANAKFSMTGGRAGALSEKLPNANKTVVDEFQAVTEGIRHFLTPSSSLLADGFILVNIGTGTSIHFITKNESIRLAGTGVGGGTMMGLASILSGEKDFSKLSEMAQKGNRSNVDLQVKDIYEPLEPPIPGHFTASNFGKGFKDNSFSKEDLLASLMGMIAETVVLLAIQTAQQKGVKDIVFIGNTLSGNPYFKTNVKYITEIFGCSFHEVDHGEFSGAVGALLL